MKCFIEDSIMQKGERAAAGSKILENFISPFDATVVTKLKSAGVEICGRAEMDEFHASALSSLPPTCASGAVEAVANRAADFALCNDFAGVVRWEALHRGAIYIHPTYGTVLRFGLIPAVQSMDQIGVVCRTSKDGFDALSIIAGHDERDGAMFPAKQYSYAAADKSVIIGIPTNVLVNRPTEQFTALEFSKPLHPTPCELKYFDLYSQVMTILCCAELSHNINRYDGIKFGHRAEEYGSLEELYTKTRTECFGESAKFAAIIGAYILSQENYERYYEKAMKIRRLIRESLEFDKYDAIMLPMLDDDPGRRLALIALSQLAGLPSVTLSFGHDGISVIADVNREDILRRVLEAHGI